MNILICEDETGFAEKLKARLCAIFSERGIPCTVVHCPSGAALQSRLESDPDADLLFMDISLGDCDGVELTGRLHREYPALTTIFLTSLEDRVAEGYDVNAFSFLFKRNFEEKLPALIERFLEEVCFRKSIALTGHGSMAVVCFSDICYLESSGRGTLIHTDSQEYLDSRPIQTFSKLLSPDSFLEIYHALFVNIAHIRRVDADSLELDNGSLLPVSRRKRKELLNAIMRRIQNR